MAAAEERRSLDPLIWKACAGSSVRIPAVGSLVYYFPQGHAEQAGSAADVASMPCNKPYFLCRVAGVQFLADRETDEVYARMRLYPQELDPGAVPGCSSPEEPGRGVEGVLSFAKVLTPSDANNGGGFSVPRFCADSIFPPLDYDEDPPVQKLIVRDMHEEEWRFRHIYRGTPRRHLLTTGWSKFVNSKKLVAGDSVVFIKNGSGELFVGVRRTGRSGVPSDFFQSSSSQISPLAAKPGEFLGGREVFSRHCKGKVTLESVVEAVRLADMDSQFEITYYPRIGSSDFVVRKDVVEAAVRMSWSTGMRVKMSVETEDSSRMTWYSGTVSRIIRHLSPFTFSPWRTLEVVTWDEPDVLQSIKRVSPWKVELLSVSPQILSPYPSFKKPRIKQNQELLTGGARENMFFPVSGSSDVMNEGMISPAIIQNIFPAGMQGARHDLICVSSLFDFLPSGAHDLFPEKVNFNRIPPKAELHNIGSESKSEGSSPKAPSNINHCGSELFCDTTVKEPANVISVSFRLFGKTIHMDPSVLADDKEGSKNDTAADRSFNVFLFDPQERLHGGHDGLPPQKIQTAEM
ncbi:hypothetical protein Taro_004041 [Colocasia esculenta]|uniref:Auxin response factor n=1 Tax=Colocasia esculenta TaxID=4460 RepID=A0A843TNE5_COLES|nr:hypothetical protein [Colocasia esculenta]